MHPRDLAAVTLRQIDHRGNDKPRIVNFAGGVENSMSLKELSSWCTGKSGPASPDNDPALLSHADSIRPFDIPWAILDSSLAEKTWCWKPEATLEMILREIQEHAIENPCWLDLVAG
jgi:CDP-paratose 2-epimerase